MKPIKWDSNTIIKFTFLIVAMLIVAIIAIYSIPWDKEMVTHPEILRAYVQSFGGFGYIVFVLLQAFVILTVFFIPVDIFLNVFAGLAYGVPIGFLLAMMGITLGAVSAFYISRLLGYEMISKFVSKNRIEKISNTLNSNAGFLSMLVIFLIPGVPKDLMMFIAGFTPVKAWKLFCIYALSRIPETLIEVSIGAQIHKRNGMEIVIISVGLVIFVAVVFTLKSWNKEKQV
jgi:uncharacterized membrane protein YdjX (TVP38/TMEM64 family)